MRRRRQPADGIPAAAWFAGQSFHGGAADRWGQEETMSDKATEKTTTEKKPIPGDAQVDEAVKLIAQSQKLREMGFDKSVRAELIRAATEILGDAWRNLKAEAREEEAAAKKERAGG